MSPGPRRAAGVTWKDGPPPVSPSSPRLQPRLRGELSPVALHPEGCSAKPFAAHGPRPPYPPPSEVFNWDSRRGNS